MIDEQEQLEGRVIKSFGKRFIVQTADGTIDCGIRGKMRLTTSKTRNPVAVGDRVAVTVETWPYGTIESVFPRRNKISRPDILKPDWEQVLMTNCDQLVVVSALAQPRLKLGAIDRFLLVAEKAELHGVVVLNKCDLVDAEAVARVTAIYHTAGYPVVATSAKDNIGLDKLRDLVRLKTSLFAGHSGVGKSSLLNAFEPGLGIKTKEVSGATGKGTHTTTTVELHKLSFGGYIADMPGIKVIGLWDLAVEELPELYPEFRPYLGQCRFSNCVHIGEPNCAVRDAIEAGTVTQERYDGYLRIRETLITGR
jgi:ribosome biogenesis GTPase